MSAYGEEEERDEMVGRDYYHTTLLSTKSELLFKKMGSSDKAVK